MITFSGNSTVPVDTLTFVEDVSQMYSILEFISPQFINSNEGTIDLGASSVEVRVISCVCTGVSYTYQAISKDTYKVLSSVSESFVGDATVKDLISARLGFECNFSIDSVATFWSIPKMRFSKLLRILTDYTVIPNGGGVHFYVDIDGSVGMFDFLAAWHRNPDYTIYGSVTGDEMNMEWFNESPGVINFYYGNSLGFNTERYVISEGYGEAVSIVSDNTNNQVELLKARFRNRFYHNYFTCRTIQLSVNSPVKCVIGMPVCLNNPDSQVLFVSSVRTTVSSVENTPVTVNLVLTTCP